MFAARRVPPQHVRWHWNNASAAPTWGRSARAAFAAGCYRNEATRLLAASAMFCAESTTSLMAFLPRLMYLPACSPTLLAVSRRASEASSYPLRNWRRVRAPDCGAEMSARAAPAANPTPKAAQNFPIFIALLLLWSGIQSVQIPQKGRGLCKNILRNDECRCRERLSRGSGKSFRGTRPTAGRASIGKAAGKLLLCAQLLGLQGDQLAEVLFFEAVNVFVELIHFARPVHGAEFRSAHGAESCFLVVIVGQRLVVHGAGGFRVEREGELLFPVEGVAGVADGVVAIAGAGTVAGDVGSVGGDLIGDAPILPALLRGR